MTIDKKPAERPILFSSEMVRAILDDRKTETRRVIIKRPWGANIVSECPYGKPGDILYVREAFDITLYFDGGLEVLYRADCDEVKCRAGKWKPSIHMPKKLSRIKLEIKEIGVERVQEITEAGAKAEGLKSSPIISARENFSALWQCLNRKRGFGWDKDPHVWVIKFERIK